MKTVAEGLSGRLAELRGAFDRSFAEPPPQRVAEFDDLLAVRMAGRRYALRLAETSGLFPHRSVTPLPGPVPALLGVAGFGGAVVPVYDLAAVLGGAVAEDPRWLVLARGTPAVALAFVELDGHLRVPSATIVREAAGVPGGGCLRGMVPLPDGTRPIIDVSAVRAAIRAMTGLADTSGER